MSTLYDGVQSSGSDAGFGNDQLDPLGTADSFPGIDSTPSVKAKGKGAKKAEKKPGGISKKMKWWGIGIGAVVVALVVFDQTAAPTVEINPVPPSPAADQGMLGGQAPDDATTLMSGGPQPTEPVQAADPTTGPAVAAASAQQPQAAAPAQQPAMESAAPAAVTQAPPPPAPVPAQAPAQAPADPTAQLSPSAAATSALESRVAELERRLARYETRKPAPVTRKVVAARKPVRNSTTPRTPAVKPGVVPASTRPLVVDAPEAPAPKPRVLVDDSVRVIGVTTRQGVKYALLEFGGVKHRVSEGEPVPGLGPVRSIAVDASGSGVVEINGVTYR